MGEVFALANEAEKETNNDLGEECVESSGHTGGLTIKKNFYYKILKILHIV